MIQTPESPLRNAAQNDALQRSEAKLHELNARLNEELAIMMRIQQVSTRLVQLEDLAELLHEILDAALDISRTDMGTVQLLQGETLKIVAHRGFEAPFLDFFNQIPGGTACGAAWQRGERVIVQNVMDDPMLAGTPAQQVMLAANALAVQCTPLISYAGHVLGILSTHYRAPHQPGEAEQRALDVLARLAADLIERKQTEQALKQSEQRFRIITEAWPVMVWMSGTDKLCFYFNKVWLDFVGRTLEQEAGNGWAENVHPDDFDRCLQIYVTNFDARRPFEMEYRLLHHSGQYRWILDHGVPRYGPDGVFEGFIGGCLDIHDQKEAAEKARIAAEKLRRNKELLDVALSASETGTFRWNLRNGEFPEFDASLQRVIGLSAEQAPRTLQEFLSYVSPEDAQSLAAAMERCREGCDLEMEFRVVSRQGNVRWLYARAKVENDEQDQPAYLIGACTNITARKQAEEALRRTEKLAATGRMAATVAHEINNPLEAVTNLVYLARRDAHTPEKALMHLNTALRELDRVAHIARQTLGFYRETSSPRRFNVSSTLNDLLALYERRLEVREIRVIKQYAEDAEIIGLPGEISQALSNLLTNAIDAMPEGGTLVVRTSYSREWKNATTGVRITIMDTGIGIQRQHRKNLFQPFFTTKNEIGTGLGLWITRNIVEKHGGAIQVKSRTDGEAHGTAFSIFLPRHEQEKKEPGGLECKPVNIAVSGVAAQ